MRTMESSESTKSPITAVDNDNLVDEAEVVNMDNKPPTVDLVDLLLRIEQLEKTFSPSLYQSGSGRLAVTALPVEITTGPTDRLVWNVNNTLTCQTSLGRNLKLSNFQLHLWRDARFTFTGPFSNESRHSNWNVSFGVQVWFKSGHRTRPEVVQSLASTWIKHGDNLRVLNNSYSDPLASLYSKYLDGELFLVFTMNAQRTN